jgi:hypothetical protein
MIHSNKSNFARSGCLLAALVVLLLSANGCSKKDANTEATPTKETAASATGRPTQAAVVSAEKTTFNEVTSQLDPGGSIYAYLSTSQWLDGLSGRVNGWRDAVLSLPNLGNEEKPAAGRAFDFITHLIKSSGIEAISGVGISGIALEQGLYQTKFVVHRASKDSPGGIWTFFGQKPRPLYELDLLPADTAWAVFFDVDAAAAWSALAKEVEQSGFAVAKDGLARLDGVVQQATGLKLDQLIGSLGGEGGGFLTLNDARKINFPLPNGGTIEVPEPGLVVVLKVKDDTLFNWIDRALQNNPQVIRSDEGGLRMRTMPVPLPLPIVLRPTVARQGDHLFLASSDELVKNMLAVKAGKLAGLKTSAEFKRLARGMPLEGNSFAFVSQRLGNTVQQIQATALSQASKQANDAPTALLQKLSTINQPLSSFMVARSTAEGWVTVGHGTQQPATAVLVPLVVAPTAIMAAMTLPALAQAKGKAQSMVCVNNLKQMGLAARIYATDHNDTLPPNFMSMTNELVVPRILICPADTKNAASMPSTWAALDAAQISYEFVSPSSSDSTPGFERKVVFRCRIHGHESMGDGSVVMKGSQARSR